MSTGGDRRGDLPVHRRGTGEGVVLRERRNWRIFSTFARQEYPECLGIIEEQLRECNGLAEYPIFVKGKCRYVYGTLHSLSSLTIQISNKARQSQRDADSPKGNVCIIHTFYNSFINCM